MEKTEIYKPSFFLVSDTQSIEITGNSTLGRSKCDITIDDSRLSSRHCEFIVRGVNLYVKDLESSNGTYINNQKLESGNEVEFNLGDTLLIGSSVFKLQPIASKVRKAEAHAMTFKDIFLPRNFVNFYSSSIAWTIFYLVMIVLGMVLGAIISSSEIIYPTIAQVGGIVARVGLLLYGLSLLHSYLNNNYFQKSIFFTVLMSAVFFFFGFVGLVIMTTGHNKSYEELKTMIDMKRKLPSSFAKDLPEFVRLTYQFTEAHKSKTRSQPQNKESLYKEYELLLGETLETARSKCPKIKNACQLAMEIATVIQKSPTIPRRAPDLVNLEHFMPERQFILRGVSGMFNLSQGNLPANWTTKGISPEAEIYHTSILVGDGATVLNLIIEVHKDSQRAWLSLGDDLNFENKSPIMSTKDEIGSNIINLEFPITYKDGTILNHSMRCMRPRDSRLQCLSTSGRQGKLPNSDLTFVIMNTSGTGDFSQMDHVTFYLASENERRLADENFKIGNRYYKISEINPMGTKVVLEDPLIVRLEGMLKSSKGDTPVKSGQITLREFKTIAREDGYFQLNIPEGFYVHAKFTAEGYIPKHEFISHLQRDGQNLNILLDPVMDPKPKGKIILKNGESYHFLGQGDDGEFTYNAFSNYMSANGKFQLGLASLGKLTVDNLSDVTISSDIVYEKSVLASLDHVYVTKAKKGEDDRYIVFRVLKITPKESMELEYEYR